MPTHPVFNVNKPEKVVNDAVAVNNGTSLNNSLITGPDLNSLVGVLRYGWRHSERGSYRSDVSSSSRGFPWIHINAYNQGYETQMLVHVFGAKESLTCAIYTLQQTTQDNKEKFSLLTLETV